MAMGLTSPALSGITAAITIPVLRWGIAPDAEILSIRVLDDTGIGSYADVIEGIQYVVANKDTFNIRIMNLSLSAPATVPYFVDPL